MTGGAGSGNKMTDSGEPAEGGYRGNAELAMSSDPYSGNSGYGSGATGGAGSGNKLMGSDASSSSGGESSILPNISRGKEVSRLTLVSLQTPRQGRSWRRWEVCSVTRRWSRRAWRRGSRRAMVAAVMTIESIRQMNPRMDSAYTSFLQDRTVRWDPNKVDFYLLHM